jgi:hypothetical protein
MGFASPMTTARIPSPRDVWGCPPITSLDDGRREAITRCGSAAESFAHGVQQRLLVSQSDYYRLASRSWLGCHSQAAAMIKRPLAVVR